MENKEALAYLGRFMKELERETGEISWKILTKEDEYHLQLDEDGLIIIPPDDVDYKIHYKIDKSGINARITSQGVTYQAQVLDGGMLDFGPSRPPHPEILSAFVTHVDQHMAELSAQAVFIQRLAQQVMSSLNSLPTIEHDPGEERASQRNNDLASIPELSENTGESQALHNAKKLSSILANVNKIKTILREYSACQAHLALVNNGLLPVQEKVILADLPTMSLDDINQLRVQKKFRVIAWNSNNQSHRVLVSSSVTEPTLVMYQSALNNNETPTLNSQTFPGNIDSVVVPHEDAFSFELGQALFDGDAGGAFIMQPSEKGLGIKSITIKDENKAMEYKTLHSHQQIELLGPILSKTVEEVALATGLEPDEVLNRLDKVELDPQVKRDHLRDLGL